MRFGHDFMKKKRLSSEVIEKKKKIEKDRG
jgi:hypothetical protein